MSLPRGSTCSPGCRDGRFLECRPVSAPRPDWRRRGPTAATRLAHDRANCHLHRPLRVAGCRSSEGYHVGSTMIAELEAKRARLAAVERELARLGDRHDLAMSEFKFDEAREVQQRIEVLERERTELVDALPPPPQPPPATPPPEMLRRRRLARRRRRLLRR